MLINLVFIRILFIFKNYKKYSYIKTKSKLINKQTIKQMPRKQSLAAVVPNRFYEINATLKYQHIGQNNITGIIEQNNIQSKILLPKDGVQLEQGKSYTFGKCFNSRNGWLYARNPSQTVVKRQAERMSQQPQQQQQHNLLQLEQIYSNKQKLMNHYISTQLMVISIEPKKTIKQKNDELLFLYKLKCFANNLMVDVQIWNQQLSQAEIKTKILNFIGFKLKSHTHDTISLVSTVYSRIQEADNVSVNGYYENVLYRNISSVFDVRTIEQTHRACQKIHKNYTLCMASINFVEEFSYQGCQKCKKKTGQNGCYQCGTNIKTVTYKYLRAVLQDDTDMIECAIFDGQYLEIAKRLHENGNIKAIFKIKSAAKRNHQTNQIYTSHVVTEIKQFAHTQ